MTMPSITKNLKNGVTSGCFQYIVSWAAFACVASLASLSNASESTNSISARIGYIDNVGFAASAADRISDSVIELSASKTFHNTIGTSHTISYGADLTLEKFGDFPYDRASAGLSFNYQRKLGIGFDKPRISFNWTGAKHHYQQSSLDSLTSTLGISLSKPLSSQLDSSISLERHWEIPDNTIPSVVAPAAAIQLPSSTSNIEFTSLQLSAEYYASERWSIPFSLQYIDGDLTTISTRPLTSLENFSALSREPELGARWNRFRFSGDVTVGAIAASRLLNDGSTVNFEFEHADGESDGGIGYDRHLFSVIWLKSW